MATRPSQYPRWATSGVKTQPTSAQQSQGWGVGQKPPAQVDNWWKDLADQWVEYFDALMSLAMFGDGSDGAAVLDGTNTVAWATKVGNVYTMTRDAQLTDLTVTGAGVELRLGSSAAQTNFRLFGQGTLATLGGAIITANGGAGANPGSASGAGTWLAGNASSCGGGTGGGPGGATNGTAGVAAFFAAGGVGGSGGNGSAGAGAAGGAITVNAATSAANPGLHFYSGPHLFGYAVGGGLGTLFTGNQGYVTPILGGTGGGGGGGGSVGSGGGGGGAGGVLAIAFRNIVLANATDLQAKGGAGGSNSGTNDGGGGGGGGGAIFLVYLSFTITGGGSLSAAVNCAGGVGGAGTGTGVAGSTGANGAIYAQNYGGGAAAALPTVHVEKGVINMSTGGSGAGFDFGVASFSSNFAALPGSIGGYVPQVTLTPTDAAVAAPGFKITFALNQMTITPVEQFNGIISWRAEV